MDSPTLDALRELNRLRFEDMITAGLARRVYLFRVHHDSRSASCGCGFARDCSVCYGTGLVRPYRTVEEILVQKIERGCPDNTESVPFLFAHNEPIQTADVFYWREIGERHVVSIAYHVVNHEVPLAGLGITKAMCRVVPAWSPLVKFPLVASAVTPETEQKDQQHDDQ